jgi:hypothetical protein
MPDDAKPARMSKTYVAGPAERALISHMQIVMHDWPKEARENTRDHLIAALDEAFRKGMEAVAKKYIETKQ